MWLNNLPDILRAAGLTVEVDPEFKVNNHGGMNSVQSIMCHHTAGPPTGDRPSYNTVKYGRPDLQGPLAQLFLARSGVWVCVSSGKAYHAGDVKETKYNNSNSVGIEAEATGVDKWPVDQYNSYARGVGALADAFHAEILGHKEACSPTGRKIDPNFDMNQFRHDCVSNTEDDLKDDERAALFEILKQLTGSSKVHEYLGYTSWRYLPEGMEQQNLTLVDFVRSIDRELNSYLGMEGRPGADTDSLYGQVLSLRAELLDIVERMDAAITAFVNRDTD